MNLGRLFHQHGNESPRDVEHGLLRVLCVLHGETGACSCHEDHEGSEEGKKKTSSRLRKHPLRNRRAQGFRCALLLTALLALVAAGCAVRPAVPERLLASSQHHVSNGVKLLSKGRLDAAHREFRITIDLDPECALAHRGEAVVFGVRGNFEEAFSACHRAVRYTTRKDLRNPLQEAFSRCGTERWNRGGWRGGLGDEEITCPARLLVVEFLNEYYHMGVAFKFGQGHDRQQKGLQASLLMTGAFSDEALDRLHGARALDGFVPETEFARGVVFLDRISRAEAAALLVRELRLTDRLESEAAPFEPWPPDLKGHPLEDDLRVVLGLGIEGFSLFEDASFRPDSPMLRAEYACAAADVLARLGGTRAAGAEGPQLSPYEDVALSSPCLRSMAVCGDLGVLSAEKGRFRPRAPLSGVEAAKSVHRLKELTAPEAPLE